MSTEIKYNKDGSIAKKRRHKHKNKEVENPVTTTGTVVQKFAEPENEPEVEAEEDTSMEGVIENPPEAEKKDISPKVKKNNVPVCSRCGKEIKTSVYRLNLTYLTSTPPWHRNITKKKHKICKECANGLSDLIDKWFIEGGAETKFPVPEKVIEEVKEEVKKDENFDF